MKKFILLLAILLLTTPILADSGNCPKGGDFALKINIPGFGAAFESLQYLADLYSVGIIYHLSDGVFMRGSFLFNKYDNDNGSSRTYLGGSLDILFALSRINSLTLYAGPGFSFITDNNGDNDGEGDDAFTAQIKLGVQYNLTKNLAIFGDFGFGMLQVNSFNGGLQKSSTYLGTFGAFAGLAFYL